MAASIQITSLGVVVVTGTGARGSDKAFRLDVSSGRFGHEVGAGSSVALAAEAEKAWPAASAYSTLRHLPIRRGERNSPSF